MSGEVLCIELVRVPRKSEMLSGSREAKELNFEDMYLLGGHAMNGDDELPVRASHSCEASRPEVSIDPRGQLATQFSVRIGNCEGGTESIGIPVG